MSKRAKTKTPAKTTAKTWEGLTPKDECNWEKNGRPMRSLSS
jgi:hypothetical protein